MLPLANRVVTAYLQKFGSLDERINVLNEVVKAAGIDAVFQQKDGLAGWFGSDCELAVVFRQRLDRCWPRGRYELETALVASLIEEFRSRSGTLRKDLT